MEKLDLRKQYHDLYAPPSKTPILIEVPPLLYIMVDGHGDPNVAPEYAQAIQVLYSLSYTLKFQRKKAYGQDYGVMGLEGLWWAADMSKFKSTPKADWDWTMMILQPDFITPTLFDEARRSVAAKGKAPLIERTRLETYHEGTSVQIMYFGSYADEGPTIANLHQFAFDHGYSLHGKHHEIYLSDPRRVPPEKLKTIIRQPVQKE